MSIIKNGRDFIYGGYTSVSWSTNSGFKMDKNAFLFRAFPKPCIFAVKNANEAVYHSDNCLLQFGSGPDLRIFYDIKNHCANQIESYCCNNWDLFDKYIGHSFEVIELEVYSVN